VSAAARLPAVPLHLLRLLRLAPCLLPSLVVPWHRWQQPWSVPLSCRFCPFPFLAPCCFICPSNLFSNTLFPAGEYKEALEAERARRLGYTKVGCLLLRCLLLLPPPPAQLHHNCYRYLRCLPRQHKRR